MTELFQYDSCSDAVTNAGIYLAKQLSDSSGQILLLLSGGSSLNPVHNAFKQVNQDIVKRTDLAQIDERFVDINSADSNWKTIRKVTGSAYDNFDKKVAILECGDTPEDAVITYEMELNGLLESADYIIGVYGFGADGHIAGIKPTQHPEDFMRFLDGRLAVSYKAPDFIRITTTHSVLTRIDEAIVFGCGPDKIRQLEKFNESTLAPHIQPMQLFKDLKHATFFIGETV